VRDPATWAALLPRLGELNAVVQFHQLTLWNSDKNSDKAPNLGFDSNHLLLFQRIEPC
jgi:hypothetical protein